MLYVKEIVESGDYSGRFSFDVTHGKIVSAFVDWDCLTINRNTITIILIDDSNTNNNLIIALSRNEFKYENGIIVPIDNSKTRFGVKACFINTDNIFRLTRLERHYPRWRLHNYSLILRKQEIEMRDLVHGQTTLFKYDPLKQLYRAE